MTTIPTPQSNEIGGETLWELLLVGPGPRPTQETDKLLEILNRGLWAQSQGTDSDGDWDEVEPMSEWRYWYHATRPESDQRFIVEAIGEVPLTFSINSTSTELTTVVARFFRDHCGGALVADAELSTRLRTISPS
ncbi:hypothetical protein EEB18_013880 [Sphingopyxis sp. OPL5]|uniref:hypothetical protein n=1 Tax=Sphingopyxis sp. OPL5 TaxID=2486273 RepID=UPI00164E1F38|nr:hypothetical protein [Sphingopyxis sp. OPL5]QNO25872.1 hypothetical protein EEB18_013880 [Sphingopyxis sp. OPL5]